MRATQKFGEHEQASTRLYFASKSSKGKILRAVKDFNGPFITPKKDTFHFFIVNCNTLSSNSFLYIGFPNNLLHKLQWVQLLGWFAMSFRRFDHITPTLFSLHWLPIRYRIQFKILLFTYKALNGFAPAYITELLNLQTIPRYNLRCKVAKKTITSVSQYKNSHYSRWPFIYRPPRHQNYGTIYRWFSAMPLKLPILNAFWKPTYLFRLFSF